MQFRLPIFSKIGLAYDSKPELPLCQINEDTILQRRLHLECKDLPLPIIQLGVNANRAASTSKKGTRFQVGNGNTIKMGIDNLVDSHPPRPLQVDSAHKEDTI